MCSALAANEKELAAKLADSVEKFNSILTRLKSSDEDRLATFFILHCNKEYDLVYEERKTNDPRGWAEEGELLARFFLTVFAWRKAGAVGGHC